MTFARERALVGLLIHELGHAKIGDLHPAALVEQDVRRLDVAMHDPFVVNVLQCLANLRHNRQSFPRGQLAGIQQLPQRQTIDELHEKVIKALLLAEVVDRDDMRVAENGQCPGFAGKSLGKGRITGGFRQENVAGQRTGPGSFGEPCRPCPSRRGR